MFDDERSDGATGGGMVWLPGSDPEQVPAAVQAAVQPPVDQGEAAVRSDGQDEGIVVGTAPWRGPGESAGTAVGIASRVLAAGEGAAGRAEQFSEGELVGALHALDEVRARVERLTVRALVEVLDRGVPGETGLSAHDWLTLQCPWLSRGQVAELVTVARGISEPAHREVAAALWSGVLPVRRAASLLRALGRVRPVTDTETYESDVQTLLPVASDPDFTDAQLRRVTDHLIAVALPEEDTEARVRAGRALRGVNESSLADGSLTRFVITAETEGAAMIRAVLTSPLAAPAPDASGPDERTSSQRRYDALLTVLGRGVAGSEGQPTTPKAQLVVTIPYDVLAGRVAGAGVTGLGELLSPATVRTLACGADLLPMVLGGEGEVLDLGRRRRLVTPGQRIALAQRDRGCSFPGCTVPATWCDAHHVLPWALGGTSDLLNYALLCRRHHTKVHELGLTATVTAFGVTWHLR